MDALDLIDPASDPRPAAARVPGDGRRGRARPSDGEAADTGRYAVARPTVMAADLLGDDGPDRLRSGRRRLRWRDATGAVLAVLARPRPAGVVITGMGLMILLLLGYLYVFTGLSAQRAQHQLLQSITANEAATYDLTSGKVPPQGKPVAVLEIPALHLVAAVVQGSDAQDLRSGPGHMPTTPLPGQPGNAVIAGRRATYGGPFGALGSVRRGDVIRVVDGYGTFRYRAQRVVSVVGGQRDVVTPTPGNHLTLVTASSGLLPDGRLALVADLVGTPVAGTRAPTFRAVPAQLGMIGDPAAGLLALAWGLVFLILLSVTAWLLRRWWQPVVVYLLAVPLLVTVALFACESVAGFLPATT